LIELVTEVEKNNMKKYIFTIFAMTTFLGAGCHNVFAQTEIDFPVSEALVISENGSCKRDGKEIDLTWLQTIEQNKLLFRGTSEETIISLKGQYVTYSKLGEASTVVPVNLSKFIMDDLGLKSEPDVLLKFSLLDGSYYIFWKETYLHQTTLQGLISFHDRELKKWCNGENLYLDFPIIENNK